MVREDLQGCKMCKMWAWDLLGVGGNGARFLCLESKLGIDGKIDECSTFRGFSEATVEYAITFLNIHKSSYKQSNVQGLT